LRGEQNENDGEQYLLHAPTMMRRRWRVKARGGILDEDYQRSEIGFLKQGQIVKRAFAC
jgi:hypothetical protein